MHQGVVKWFSEDKGYGFIMRGNGDPDVFVHWSGISDTLRDEHGKRSLAEGQQVTFDTREGKRGIEACDVLVIG
jgi:CspA family cold shock protein